MRRLLQIGSAICFALSASAAAHATVLNFNNLTSAGVSCVGAGASSCYGDNVSAASDTYGSYSQGNGYTPNVGVSYANTFAGGAVNPGLAIWAGSSAGLVLGLPSGISQGIFTLTADSGYNVALNSFEVGVFGDQSTVFQIYSAGTLLSSIAVSSSTTVLELVGLTAPEFTIVWTNWNTGIATVNFDQSSVTPTPVPAALPLLATGLAGLGYLARRRRRKQA